MGLVSTCQRGRKCSSLYFDSDTSALWSEDCKWFYENLVTLMALKRNDYLFHRNISTMLYNKASIKCKRWHFVAMSLDIKYFTFYLMHSITDICLNSKYAGYSNVSIAPRTYFRHRFFNHVFKIIIIDTVTK